MKSVCVYCGSSSGAGTAYLAMARELAKEIARRNIRLIYGGASIGLMGEVADTVMSEGGKVTGVLPRNLFRQEVPHNGLTELIEVDSMHERKALMVELADGFIALPGGMGTIEEFLLGAMSEKSAEMIIVSLYIQNTTGLVMQTQLRPG